MAEIIANTIPGLNVYGLQQVEYTVDGLKDADFGTALSIAALQHADTIEEESSAFSSMVRLRMRQLEELGEALSIISEAISSLPTDGAATDDPSHADPALWTADAILKKYDLPSLNVDPEEGTVTRESLMKRKNELQHRIDTEDNTLQQDMLALQSLVSKRDESFSNASKMLSKVNNTSQTIIGNFGA